VSSMAENLIAVKGQLGLSRCARQRLSMLGDRNDY
jgi:hypothetical protein